MEFQTAFTPAISPLGTTGAAAPAIRSKWVTEDRDGDDDPNRVEGLVNRGGSEGALEPHFIAEEH